MSDYQLFIDEFQIFIDDRIGEILDQCRKHRLFLRLAHQHWGQFEGNRAIKTAILANCRSKYIFGGMTPDMANHLATILRLGDPDILLDLKPRDVMVKHDGEDAVIARTPDVIDAPMYAEEVLDYEREKMLEIGGVEPEEADRILAEQKKQLLDKIKPKEKPYSVKRPLKKKGKVVE